MNGVNDTNFSVQAGPCPPPHERLYECRSLVWEHKLWPVYYVVYTVSDSLVYRMVKGYRDDRGGCH